MYPNLGKQSEQTIQRPNPNTIVKKDQQPAEKLGDDLSNQNQLEDTKPKSPNIIESMKEVDKPKEGVLGKEVSAILPLNF